MVLLVVFVQDVLSRSVYWVCFPLLAIVLLAYKLIHFQAVDVVEPALINVAFLAMQLLIVSAWFSLKRGKWINITSGLLGWGDILLLVCLACYLSVLNFLFFYVVSLILILVFWFFTQLKATNRDIHIPLAGLQALLFILVLSVDWWLSYPGLTDDGWLLKLFVK
jgi:hypothetical protein